MSTALTRRCGSCTACCTTLGIAALDKPERQRCPFQCAAGCARYATRPTECGAYACAWLGGWGGQGDRPDRLGLILDGGGAGGATVAREVRPGAAAGERARRVLDDLAARSIVVTVAADTGERRMRGPERLVRALLALGADALPR